MTDKDAIPTTEEGKNCGTPSAEELGESKETVVRVELILCHAAEIISVGLAV